MTVKLFNEEMIPLKSVGKHLPRRANGKQVHRSVIWRWALKGIRGTRLEVYRVGGTTYTSIQALDRFLYQINKKDEEANSRSLLPQSSATRGREIRKASREVDAILGRHRTKDV